MEDQLRSELTYINKLSKMTLSHAVTSEYKPEISKALMQIDNSFKYNIEGQDQNDKDPSKQTYNKHKKTVAFPGKNDNILDDMVEIASQQITNKSKNNSKPKGKQKSGQKSSSLNTMSACKLL